MKRILLVLALLLTVTFMLVGCNTTTNQGGTQRLVVGMECDYSPFNYTETEKTAVNVPIENVPGGYADGYDVRIAKRIAEALGMELVIRAYEWSGLIPALRANEIDLIIAGMSDTEERREQIDFTNPYYRSEEVVLMSTNSSFKNATSINDFSGAKVIGQTGTIYADLVPQLVEKGAVAGTNLDTVPQILNAIKTNVVDVTIVELPVANGIVAQNPEFTFVRLNPGFEVSESDVAVSIGIRKNYELKARINEVLNSITEEQRVSIMNEVIG